MIQVSVQQAAMLLGTSAENIRIKARREQLKSKKIDGRVFILLNDEYAAKAKRLQSAGVEQAPDTGTVINELQAEIERLKKENHSLITSVQKLTALLERGSQ